MQEHKRIFRRRLLVLSGHQLAFANHVRIVRSNTRILRAGLLQHRLRIMGDAETASEHLLQALIAFERIAGRLAPVDPRGDVPERYRAVTDRSNHLVLRPEMFEYA